MEHTDTHSIQILGFTEEMTNCDRCGRSELKGTYTIDVEGIQMHLGSSCIAKRFEMTQKEVNNFISSEKRRIVKEYQSERNAIQKEMEIALDGVDFWEDYERYCEIEKPYKKRLESLKRPF